MPTTAVKLATTITLTTAMMQTTSLTPEAAGR
jgi:hypothetical protein